MCDVAGEALDGIGGKPEMPLFRCVLGFGVSDEMGMDVCFDLWRPVSLW